MAMNALASVPTDTRFVMFYRDAEVDAEDFIYKG